MSAPAAPRSTTRARIYYALIDLAAQHGRPPTIREIAEQAGLSSTGHLTYHMKMLVALGLARHLGGARGYVPVRRT
jgi:DNA-binding IscR family transcriptional regulator